MSKPRRGTEAVFFDTFADWTIADQAAALRVLEALHRQKKRDAGKAATKAELVDYSIPAGDVFREIEARAGHSEGSDSDK